MNQPRITPVNPDTADAKAKPILESTKKSFGKHLNFFSTLAHAPAVLHGYTGLSSALRAGSLSPKIREEIAVAVSARNGCDYCLTAHGHAAGANGIGNEELKSLFDGKVNDPGEQAAVSFAMAVLESQGRVKEADLESIRTAGFTDGEILEITAHVAMTFFSNALNNVSDPEIDLPDLPVTS